MPTGAAAPDLSSMLHKPYEPIRPSVKTGRVAGRPASSQIQPARRAQESTARGGLLAIVVLGLGLLARHGEARASRREVLGLSWLSNLRPATRAGAAKRPRGAILEASSSP